MFYAYRKGEVFNFLRRERETAKGRNISQIAFWRCITPALLRVEYGFVSGWCKTKRNTFTPLKFILKSQRQKTSCTFQQFVKSSSISLLSKLRIYWKLCFQCSYQQLSSLPSLLLLTQTILPFLTFPFKVQVLYCIPKYWGRCWLWLVSYGWLILWFTAILLCCIHKKLHNIFLKSKTFCCCCCCFLL